MTSTKRDRLDDPVYAHEYFAGLQDMTLAAQIRVIREQRGWTQEELAARTGISQARISQLESADGSGRTLSTLRKLARGLDVGLHVSFAPFLQSLGELENQTPISLQVVARPDELAQTASNQYLRLGFGSSSEPNMLRFDLTRPTAISPVSSAGEPTMRTIA